MKNGMLIWNILLSLLVGFLLILHLSPKSKNTSTKQVVVDTGVSNNQFRMAYFEMDSVAANFEQVKELKAELAVREQAITNEMQSRTNALQQKYDYYQKLAKAGTLTQEQSEAASREMKGMDDEMKNKKQQMDQDYNNYMMTKQNEIKSKIEAFIKEYNKTKNYSYVVSDDPGLFYFQDTAYNITSDVIRGLNEMYKSGKKQ